MRITVYFLVLLFFSFGAKAQIVSKHKFFKTLHDLGFIPVEGEFLFIDQTEVSNIHYKEFLAWLKKYSDSATYDMMLPDTACWRYFCEPYVNYYFQHPAYADYPVVGINFNQAQAYCKWRADRIMDVLRLNNSEIEAIEVRLPSEAEWKKAARGTLPDCAKFPWEEDGIRRQTGKKRDRGLVLANMRRGGRYVTSLASRVCDGGMITAPVGSYWPNTINLYNIAGNVSEWVEEHKAMGSSWNGFPQQASLEYSPPVISNTTSLATLGFRCVLEIVSLKKELQTKPLQLNAKMIEKQMIYLPFDSIRSFWDKKHKLFASSVETTNLMFNTFLAETGKTEFVPQSENWYTYTRYYHMQMYSWHPYYDEFPVVNISYDAVLAYCQWLTDKYNSLEKRKYHKVVFRLPTELQWIYAAEARVGSIYPWGGPSTLNSYGAYLANFCPLEEKYLAGYDLGNHIKGQFLYNYPNDDYTISRKADGIEFLCEANGFYPNDYGIYQCAGNAAEIVEQRISEKLITKGGSWDSNQNIISIYSWQYYQSPNPTIGFRVFMEVIEF